MFDIGSAIVLGLVLTGLISLVRNLAFGTMHDRLVVICCLVVSIIAVLLVAASDFAHENVVLDRSLDTLNFWSQMVVALLLSGLASGIWQGFEAVKNVGQNQHVAVEEKKVV